jgi:hypothetical protein
MQIRTTRLGSIALGCLVAATLSCRPAPDTATPSVPNETASAPDAVASTPSQATEESAPAPSATEAAPDTAAVAPATPPPPLPEECNNPQTQLDMNRCTQAEYAQADAQLNQVYQRVKAEATGNAEAALVNAEKAWIEFLIGLTHGNRLQRVARSPRLSPPPLSRGAGGIPTLSVVPVILAA